MKKILLLTLALGAFNFSYAQLDKEDIKEIFSEIDIKSYPKFFITFNTDGSDKHKMENENLASYEALNTKTLKLDFKDNYIKVSGDSYVVFLPYDKIKYIHTVKEKSIQIRVSQ